MLKRLALVLFLGTTAPVHAQGLEPGEWEFNAVTSSPLFPGGQSTVFTRCIRKEDAENPERWMARQSETGDCKLTPGERTPDSMKWEMSCPKTDMRGSGIARLTGPGRVEAEMRMTREFQGHRIQLNTRTSGRRLGPCKT
jgi:Protein of unknown function (DUF3617)